MPTTFNANAQDKQRQVTSGPAPPKIGSFFMLSKQLKVAVTAVALKSPDVTLVPSSPAAEALKFRYFLQPDGPSLGRDAPLYCCHFITHFCRRGESINGMDADAKSKADANRAVLYRPFCSRQCGHGRSTQRARDFGVANILQLNVNGPGGGTGFK